MIKLDANYAEGKLSSAASRTAIVQDLRSAARGIRGFTEILDQPHNTDVRKWLQLNGAVGLN